MRISHVIFSIDNSWGGPPRSVTHLLSVLAAKFPNLLLRLHTKGTDDPIIIKFHSQNIDLLFHKIGTLGKLNNLEEEFSQLPSQLYHGHGIWDMPVHQMAKVARKLEIPYIISPRGMLEPWSLQQSKFKKMLALRLYQYKDLQRAVCLHATAHMEAESMRALGLKNPIAVIPNGVLLEDFETKKYNKSSTHKKILFLSRIHPKKGIELLIEAWNQLATIQTQDWGIDIIGNGESGYIKELQSNITNKGLSKSIQIKAPVDGKEKMEAYKQASLFVLPTYSENFGIVVAEALACGTPVITTRGAPWQDLESYNCGWWIQIGVEPLKEALEQALTLPSETLVEMGKNGRQLIEQKYSMHAVAEQMHQLYAWILNNIKRPDFVRLD